MTRNVIVGLLALIGIAMLIYFFQEPSVEVSEESIVPGSSKGEQLYNSNCALCHNGAAPEAPRMETLKLLSPSRIVETMNSGVMRNQASTLSKDERNLIATYISETKEIDETANVIKGLCEEELDTNSKVKVSNWGFDLNNTRYQNHDDIAINASNVSTLKLNWAFAFPGATRARVQVTIAGNTIYTASQFGTIYALDKNSGCIRWTFQADEEVRSALTIEADSEGNAIRLYFGDFSAKVYALDLKTKKLIWKQQVDTHEVATITGSMNLHEGKLYIPVSSMEIQNAANPNYKCCTFRGSVVSLDARTGERLWKSYTITEEPREQGLNKAGNPKYAPSGAPVWTSPAIDAKRGVLYIGTGENYTMPTTNSSDAIIAMSLKDGSIQWIKQTIPQDSWNGACMFPGSPNCPDVVGPDYDFGASAILVNRENAPSLILAGQKSGMVYALDPDRDGIIVWQKRVGRGGMMGGVHWGMATDGSVLYVPINDHDVYPDDVDKPGRPGVHAVDLNNGNILWSAIERDRIEDGVGPASSAGISAAISLTPEVVYAAALDGMFKAFATKDGKELWAYDTNRDFETVNGVKGFGGTIDSDGPVIDGEQLFINSGYAKFGEKAGNVLLAFGLQ